MRLRLLAASLLAVIGMGMMAVAIVIQSQLLLVAASISVGGALQSMVNSPRP